MKAIDLIPDIDINYTKTENLLKVNIKNNSKPDNRVLIQKLNKARESSWWLVLAQDNQIVELKKVYLRSNASKDF